ncbi:hypothetical protein AG74_106 [Vibrio phage AG74]|uniref:Uncharacterized protein n=1 Tax=Vibrio phage AG74 TaxID=2736261 RepID=A0A6M9Z0J9_9CAUD|nr:hypothetical protein KNV06_gp188 [Vibrio phage AG74]QKN84955.1 hypothetical protein AG74_106 [Vibrio phage AG74]
MFSGWFSEVLQSWGETKRLEREAEEKFKKEHPIRHKTSTIIQKVTTRILIVFGVLWMTVLPAYGLYELVAKLF